MRQYGYALLCVTPICDRSHASDRHISAIAALSSDGIVAIKLKSGNVNFYDFIRGSLIPNMHRCSKISSNSG